MVHITQHFLLLHQISPCIITKCINISNGYLMCCLQAFATHLDDNMAQLPVSIHAGHIFPTHTYDSHSNGPYDRTRSISPYQPICLAKTAHIATRLSTTMLNLPLPGGSSTEAAIPTINLSQPSFHHHHHQHHLCLQNKAPT